MVHKGDRENSDFKACALRNFDRSSSTKLIIAIDATKIFQDIEQHQSVLPESEWLEMISNHSSRITIVTSPLRPEVKPEKRMEFDQEIAQFESLGIDVDSGANNHE